MIYHFKDDGSHIIKPLQRKIYFIIGIFLIAKLPFDYLLFNYIDITDPINLGLGIFMIWGINKNGFYKIVRWYTERRLKKFDNKWR